MKIQRCNGEGQGSCKRCSDNGKWNMAWMSFLYEIEGMPGVYCWECVKKIAAEKGVGLFKAMEGVWDEVDHGAAVSSEE